MQYGYLYYIHLHYTISTHIDRRKNHKPEPEYNERPCLCPEKALLGRRRLVLQHDLQWRRKAKENNMIKAKSCYATLHRKFLNCNFFTFIEQ